MRLASSGSWTALATVAMAITTIFYTKYARRQWQEMQGSGRQTDQLLCLYQRQLERLTEQARDTHDIAVGSLIQAAAVTRAEAGQIKIDRNGVNLTPSLGKELGNSISIANIGNTSALNVRFKSMIKIVKEGKEPKFVYSDPTPNHAETGFVSTGDSSTMSIYAWDGKNKLILSNEDYGHLKEGAEYVVEYGRVTYQDIFGNSHWTQFCLHFDASNTDPNSHPKCAAYNRTDSTPVFKESVKEVQSIPKPPKTPCVLPNPN